MELIIGGASQGKLSYAKQKFATQSSDIASTLDSSAKIITDLHLIIRNLLENQEDAYSIILNYADSHPNIVFICNEVGAGLVPIDKFEREYRETVGEICCALAVRATKVHRIYCGIGFVIKDE